MTELNKEVTVGLLIDQLLKHDSNLKIKITDGKYYIDHKIDYIDRSCDLLIIGVKVLGENHRSLRYQEKTMTKNIIHLKDHQFKK